MKIFNKDFSIDLKKCILWQYDKAQKLSALILAKENWYERNVTNFIKNFAKDVLDINTANDFGLSVWGKLLGLDRTVVFIGGTAHYLTTEQYRFLLKGQIMKFNMQYVSVPEINKYLRVIFNEEDNSQVFVRDNLDMTMTYTITKNMGIMQEEITQLLNYYDFLPRPTGVGINVVLNYNGYFGFEGAGNNRGGFADDEDTSETTNGGIFLN